MKFLDIEVDSPAFLAPLAGFTDSTFRFLCREFGAGMVFTEMISAEGIARQNTKTLRYAFFNQKERPIGIQLFGENPKTMANAAQKMSLFKPDVIDLNSGCPVKKVVKKGAGSALLKDLNKLGEIVKAVVDSTDIPVTVKIRSGWDKEEVVAVEAAGIIESAGAAAIIVHPRTRSMQFSGKADWDIIRAVKQAVSIPVIGNGDVVDFTSAKKMFDDTGCDFLMIGRASIHRPWLFGQIKSYYCKGVLPTEPVPVERIKYLLRHIELKVSECGEYHGVVGMRKNMAWYTKGMPGSTRLRGEIMKIDKYENLVNVLKNYMQEISGITEIALEPVSEVYL